MLMSERAFWTFGRGQRLGDMRRAIRVYGRDPALVFATGNYYKNGGTYGSSTSFPVAVDEDGNAFPTACSDRSP
jgi:hypothetical protein